MLRAEAAVGDQADASAVASCRAGSVESFGPLVERHGPRIIRFCYHFLGDWEEARDIAQETFARAFLSLNRYDPNRPFHTWLSTIAARLAIDRTRRRRREVAARTRLGSTPASVPLDQESSLSLREALHHLTARQRQSVVICDLNGYTATEAARMIGCTASTVRVLRFLARRRLREALEPESVASEDRLLSLEKGK